MPSTSKPRRRKARKKTPAPRRGHDTLVVIALLIAIACTALLTRGWWTVSVPPARSVLTRDQARAINAAIPFVGGRLAPARPLRFRGTPAAREQAIQCLATAALYEAGDDARSQKAVIQVILNRFALPQYPKTICGVVYQGATRTSGCQFSFACDGSVTRRPEHAGWEAARLAARRALSGYVFAPVGRATHYHTDWVVPYWSSTLDKVAQIRSHIFYRPHGREIATPDASRETGTP